LIRGLGQYEFDPDTVETDFLPVPTAEEMAAVGRELLLDVPMNKVHGDYSQDKVSYVTSLNIYIK
jgi:hypothetical protein